MLKEGEGRETEKIRFDPRFMQAVQSWLRRLSHLPFDRELQLEQLKLHSIDSWYSFYISEPTLTRIFSAFVNLEITPNHAYIIKSKKPLSLYSVKAFKTKLKELCQTLSAGDAINQALDAMEASASSAQTDRQRS